jgi:hypothetical protein
MLQGETEFVSELGRRFGGGEQLERGRHGGILREREGSETSEEDEQRGVEGVFALVRSGFTLVAQSEAVHAASGEFTTEKAEVRELGAIGEHGGDPRK